MERSLLAFETYHNSAEKFDYFVLGVIGAFCAYLSQNIELQPLGLNGATIELAALVVLLSSGVAGFFRLEVAVDLRAINQQRLHLSEKKGQIVSNFGGGMMMNSSTGEVLGPRDAALEVAAIDQVIPGLDRRIERYPSSSGIRGGSKAVPQK